MKHVIMKKVLIAGIALLTVPSAFAQKEKGNEDKTKDDKKEVQTIVITRTGDKADKMVVEVQGDKITVNGKDIKDYKDGDVRVQNFSNRPGVIHLNGTTAIAGDNFTFNGSPFPLFSEDENRAMLGVTTEGDEKGAEILSVTKESAAEKAGLKKGDIITKIDQRKIESSDEVTDAIRNHKPGDKVSITYLREGKSQTSTAELTKWKGVRVNTVPRVEGFGGFGMGDLNQRYREAITVTGRPKLGLSIQDTDDGLGVKVLDVDQESAAAKAGIKKDDIILGVDDTDVKGTEDVVRATRTAPNKTSYNFKIKRGNSTQTIELKIPRKLKTADL